MTAIKSPKVFVTVKPGVRATVIGVKSDGTLVVKTPKYKRGY